MGEHTRQDVARRAGVDPEYVDRLVELGILTPGREDAFSTGDVRRARWVRSLERGRRAARRDGRRRPGRSALVLLPGRDRLRSVRGDQQRRRSSELSERTGIPFDLLKVVREAVGFAEPRPEDHVREDELSVVPAIELQLSSGFRPVVIERWLRVCARRPAPDRRDGDGLVADRGRAAPPARRDDGDRDAGGPSRRRVPDDPHARAGARRPSTASSRNTPGARAPWRTWRARWNGPACTAGCTGRRPCASSTSAGTRG